MDSSRGPRAVAFVTVLAVAALAVACGGSTGSSPTVASAAAIPGASLPPCDGSALRVDAREPVGATAMMRSVLVIADVGNAPCRLSLPQTMRFLANDGTVVATGQALPAALPEVDVAPSRPPVHGEPRPPAGAAYVGMEWTWRSGAGGACATNVDRVVRVIAEFPRGLNLASDTDIDFLPCGGDFRYELDVVPPD